MATDATGTPTAPDNIPKYNTSVDAPSGLGFNAAMDAIQTALSARVLKSLFTTAGDIIYATAASTLVRLGIGANGTVLTVAGGVPTWAVPGAGGYTVLADVTLGAPAASIDSTVFSTSGYTHLKLLVAVQDTNAAANINTVMRLNGDGSAVYLWTNLTGTNSAASSSSNTSTTSAFIGDHPGSGNSTIWSNITVEIPFSTTVRKHGYTSVSYNSNDGTNANMTARMLGGTYNVSAAISRVQLLASTNFATGSRLVVLGY